MLLTKKLMRFGGEEYSGASALVGRARGEILEGVMRVRVW